MRFSLQDPHLQKLRDEQTQVTIALSNGVKITGRIESFDQYAIIVTNDVQQMVYKSAVASIQVGRPSAFRKPRSHTPNTQPARREFNPVAASNDDVQMPTRQKEPVVIVRKKLRTIVPSSER